MTNTFSYKDVPTKAIDVAGTTFVYRELGSREGTPLVLLNHLGAVLDNWDPRVVDGIAAKRRVIAFDNRGVGASEGSTPTSIAEMANDAVAFITAMGLDQVDLLGFSMGGFVAQVVSSEHPDLVRKVILAGTGPAGGVGIEKVSALTYVDMIKGAFTLRDPKYYLFFTGTTEGRSAARAFLNRLKERTENRDKSISVTSFRAHLKAIHSWGVQAPMDLSHITNEVFVVDGDADRMVPTQNSADLARRLPNAKLTIYPDAGHGGIFQHHASFVPEAIDFLAA